MQLLPSVRPGLIISLSLCLAPIGALAQVVPSFTDVPETHGAFNAVEYLKEKGILSGYSDGTFRPDTKVNRAEAVKIIVNAAVGAETIAAFKAKSVFTDVPDDAWFISFVEYARQTLGIIDGPPKKTQFFPSQPVKKAEFLKMLLLAKKIDASAAFSDLSGPLGDVNNPADWLYPYVRYAIASSMIMADDAGMLHPGNELTRSEVALILFRLEMYREQRRTQALLTETEAEIAHVLSFLEAKAPDRAFMASNRSLIAARGALLSKPDEGIVKGAVKTAEGFQTLVRAYQAGVEGRLPDVLQLTSDAWHLAEKAKAFAPSLEPVAVQMQTIASSMADEARGLQKK
ncbi:S-layer homology domain-containing protein [Candidatus Peregrinibacteria bacterium]|nr:S-layer homology domain-containing protein [Candidatus Peregrinibacteria bacterium]